MAITTVAPSTVDGIKRLAKQIKRAQNITHHQALNLAAHQAGFENLRHAQNKLMPPPPLLYPVYLTSHWRKDGVGGRETIKVLLATPLTDLLRPNQVRYARNLLHFKMEASDHLERNVDAQSEDAAKSELAGAARTLHFMAATALRPVVNFKDRKAMRIFDDLPGRDHGSEWISRESGEWVYLNEPYAYNHGKADQWAAHQGFEVITSRWKGLYFPDNAVPTLFCSDKALATKLAQQLDALAIKGEQISGDETGRYWERYVSPARLASGNSPRRRPMPAPRGLVSAGSLPYGASSGGEASLWRPAVRMPLTFHHQVGPLLTALANAPLPASARRRVLRVRSTLDDWIQMEYPTNEEMSAEQFREAYYGHRHPPVVDGRGEELAAIKKVIETLSVGYAESKARRGLLKMLSEAQIAMEKHSAS